MKFMRKKDEPIIQSSLDVDFYKFTMGQSIYHRHPDVHTTFAFKNRTKSVRLADHIDMGELKEQLDHTRSLKYTNTGLHYIGGTFEYGSLMFKNDYIADHLKNFHLSDYELKTKDGQIDLKFHGTWPEASMWETLALSIVNELWTEAQMKDMTETEREGRFKEGAQKLADKVAFLLKNPEIAISDFGTRRRATRLWQEYVNGVLSEKLPPSQFRGTSNTNLAMKYDVVPMGTNAHELPMIYSGIYWDEDEKAGMPVSQMKMLRDWESEYGQGGLLLFLPDTYVSDYFFKNLVTPDQMKRWRGSRQDSGDPFTYTDKRIREYKELGIDPKTKLIVYADGLNMAMIDAIHRYTKEIGKTYGWGTDLTNDIGLKTLSIVVKAAEANGHPVVKLSDNIEKATGDPAAIERMKRMVGYDVNYSKECVS